MLVAWLLGYSFTSGLSDATFTGIEREGVAHGTATTKNNAPASQSNVPIYFLTKIDRWAHDRWNAAGMRFTESGLAVASALVFLALAGILLRGHAPP